MAKELARDSMSVVLVVPPMKCIDKKIRSIWVGLFPDYITVGDYYTREEFERQVPELYELCNKSELPKE